MNYTNILIGVLLLIILLAFFILTPYKYVPAGRGMMYKINRFTQEIHLIVGKKEMRVKFKEDEDGY